MSVISWILSHQILIFCVITISVSILDMQSLNKDLDPSRPLYNHEFHQNKTDRIAKYRNPFNNLTALSYELTISPVITEGYFIGRVIIEVHINDTMHELPLHCKNLTIKGVKVANEDIQFRYEENYELLILSRRKRGSFPQNYVAITIDYKGYINNNTVGIYTTTYKENNTSCNITTTIMIPTFARQVFPCLDEPSKRATFTLDIEITNATDYIVLSNVKNKGYTEMKTGNRQYHFGTTLALPTYMVSFIVCNFKANKTMFTNSIGDFRDFKVYTTPGQLNKTGYAVSAGTKMIYYYKQYFGMEYQMPKLDMVAIPNFPTNAVEHWGMLSFKETALLYSRELHSASNKQKVATVIANQLAHSWFGNVVPMEWWTDIWINEGFSSFMQYKGVSAAEPTWRIMDQFLIKTLHPVLALDATRLSHSVLQTPITPAEIIESYDMIIYNKPASLLRMLENAIGEKDFQKGVHSYLYKHSYRKPTKNFLNEITSFAGSQLDFIEIMNTYTAQVGYPMLSVYVVNNTYTLTQRRFYRTLDFIGSICPSTPYMHKWTIPITYVTDLGKSQNFTLFKYEEEQVNISVPEEAKWVKFNYDQIGYYRVNYPEQEWYNLIKFYPNMSVADRTHLLEESFSIAETGNLHYDVPFDLTQNLIIERDYMPWHAASRQLLNLKFYLQESIHRGRLDKYIRRLVTPAYRYFGWNKTKGDDHLTKLTRKVVLNLACTVGHKGCLNMASTEFKKWINANLSLPISPELRRLIIKFGMKSVDESDHSFDILRSALKTETDANVKLDIMNGLALSKDADKLHNLTIDAEKDEEIRSQDYFTLISYITQTETGNELIWNYMRTNWPKLVKRFGINDKNLGQMIRTVTNNFRTDKRLEEMESFFAQYPDAGAGKYARRQAITTVEDNIHRLSKNVEKVENWIERHVY